MIEEGDNWDLHLLLCVHWSINLMTNTDKTCLICAQLQHGS